MKYAHSSIRGKTHERETDYPGRAGWKRKATQTELLCKELAGKGIRVRKISFPDYGQPSSALAKMYLDGKFGENPEDVSAYAASSFMRWTVLPATRSFGRKTTRAAQ